MGIDDLECLYVDHESTEVYTEVESHASLGRKYVIFL